MMRELQRSRPGQRCDTHPPIDRDPMDPRELMCEPVRASVCARHCAIVRAA
jgi:hypothetical protein